MVTLSGRWPATCDRWLLRLKETWTSPFTSGVGEGALKHGEREDDKKNVIQRGESQGWGHQPYIVIGERRKEKRKA